MKKFNFLIFLLALVGLATSCSQDDSIDLKNSENNRVMLSANLQSDLQTRATSDLQLAGYSLRYILEVWSDDAGAVVYREEKLVTDASQSVPFEFYLARDGQYKALLWADYLPTGATATNGRYPDHYYTTNTSNGLKAISIISAKYVVNTRSRDAFFGSTTLIKQSSPFAGSVTMRRPFGRLNLIEKDLILLTELRSMDLAYNVPSGFNVSDGTVSGTYSVSISDIEYYPTAAIEKANMFYDYILTPAGTQSMLSGITIGYTLSNSKTGNFTIPAGIPIEQNKRTNISGNILTEPNTTLSVEISDTWTNPDYERDLN